MITADPYSHLDTEAPLHVRSRLRCSAGSG